VIDRRTNRQTDRRTEFSSLYRVCITCSAVKTVGGTRVKVLYQTYMCADVCFCPECRETPGGHTYEGDLATTVSGRTCQTWSVNYPHQHGYNLDSMYPDGSVVAAGNKCRNPASDYFDGVWCYTTDPNLRWELCHVPLCARKCIPRRVTFVEYMLAKNLITSQPIYMCYKCSRSINSKV